MAKRKKAKARHKKLATRGRRRKAAALRGGGGVRGYGPGKYNTMLDGIVHGFLMEGWGDETTGDIESTGVYDKLRLGPEAVKAALKEDPDLTGDEKNLLRTSYGAIVVENDQGFVGVSYYPSKKALDKAWAEIEEETSVVYCAKCGDEISDPDEAVGDDEYKYHPECAD